MSFSSLVIGAIAAFWFSPIKMPLLDSSLMFVIGFLIFGPQMLIGMAAAELSHKKAAGTATGFTGWVAYLGAAAAGYPLGIMTQELGWHSFFCRSGRLWCDFSFSATPSGRSNPIQNI